MLRVPAGRFLNGLPEYLSSMALPKVILSLSSCLMKLLLLLSIYFFGGWVIGAECLSACLLPAITLELFHKTDE
jgi:hypothetical protein